MLCPGKECLILYHTWLGSIRKNHYNLIWAKSLPSSQIPAYFIQNQGCFKKLSWNPIHHQDSKPHVNVGSYLPHSNIELGRQISQCSDFDFKITRCLSSCILSLSTPLFLSLLFYDLF